MDSRRLSDYHGVAGMDPAEMETRMEPDIDLTPVIFAGLLTGPAIVAWFASLLRGGRRG
jgi:hypothetical protein